MYQPPHMPPPTGASNTYVATPPRKHLPGWAVFLISFTAVVLLGLCGLGALAFIALNPPASPAPSMTSRSPTLPGTVGESLSINNVTVTLVSAKVTTVYKYSAFQNVPAVALTVHFWNQTAYEQDVSMTNWTVSADSGAISYPISSYVPPQANDIFLAPNQTYDVQFTVPLNAGDSGPYGLQTDFNTPQGQRITWTFKG